MHFESSWGLSVAIFYVDEEAGEAVRTSKRATRHADVVDTCWRVWTIVL